MTNLKDTLGFNVGIDGALTYGAMVYAGSDTLTSSKVWVSYPSSYVNAPIVVVTNTVSLGSALSVNTGSINPGSFFVEGIGETNTFNWISVGQQ